MKNKTFDTLMDGLKELHDKKNEDYAEKDNPYSNFEFAAFIAQQFDDSVDQAFATLIGIKLARLGQLKGGEKESNHESVEDTMRDLTNYCAIWTSRTIDYEGEGPIPITQDDIELAEREAETIGDESIDDEPPAKTDLESAMFPPGAEIKDIEVPKGY